jgi:catechol 2,3-dioxygenase-like lactoylglutathione lyase family enzyme
MAVKPILAPSRIWHIAVMTDSLDRSKRFYEDILGLRVIPDGERWPDRPQGASPYEWYDVGGVEVHVCTRSTFKKEGMGLSIAPLGETHISYQVDNLQESMQRLAANGVPHIDFGGIETSPGHAKHAFLRDPDGNLVELAERLPW